MIGVAVMAEYIVDLIYAATARYYFGMWLLTALVVCVAIEQWMPAWLQRHGWRRTNVALERILAYRQAQNHDRTARHPFHLVAGPQ